MKARLRDPRVYLEDIASAVNRIERYTAKGREDFLINEMVQDAVIRQFTVIGEAATKLPPHIKAANSDVPWKSVIGMRNIVIHDYSEIKLERVWETVVRDLPVLGRVVKTLLDQPSIPNAA